MPRLLLWPVRSPVASLFDRGGLQHPVAEVFKHGDGIEQDEGIVVYGQNV